MRKWPALLACTCAAWFGSCADAPDESGPPPPIAAGITIGATRVLAPLVGPMYTPAPGQRDIGMYATDLGRSTVHRGKLRLMFGDTSLSPGMPIDPEFDDVQGDISLSDFPDGPSVDAYVAAHPPKLGQLPWQAAGPPVTFLTRADRVAQLYVYRGDEALSMSLARAPVAVWSDAGDGLFGMFQRIAPLPCAASEPRCPGRFACDAGLGGPFGVQGEGIIPCVIGMDLDCEPIPGGGYCQDRTSSTYDANNPTGRRLSVAFQTQFGNEDLARPGYYLTTTINTNKFINPVARTVAEFDPQRHGGGHNVYTSATGDGAREMLFIWGRPWFSSARGRDLRVYFQYLTLPKYDARGEFELHPHYFTGVRDGVPQFSDDETDAVALDLSAPGRDPTVEVHDVVSELSISWIAPLRKWMMLYGGQYSFGILALQQGAGAAEVSDPDATIWVRFADHPWGPWSPPESMLRSHTGAREIVPLEGAPSGILARSDCTNPDCPKPEPNYTPTEHGGFYGAHLIEPWTTLRGRVLDLYWVVSTWNPYQIVLLKTSLELSREFAISSAAR